jgi:hypothetical protein
MTKNNKGIERAEVLQTLALSHYRRINEMDKNLAYRSLHLHYVKGLSISEVSAETGLRTRTVNSIVKGVKMPEVATDFFEDRKAGDLSREYPKPEYTKLSKIDFALLESRYISLIVNDVSTVEEIGSYLLEDSIEPKQAKKMLGHLTKVYKAMQGELLDKKLKAILDVLAKPCKWIMTDTGLKTVYVLPVLDEKLNVIGTELKPTRSFVIPDELWSRYITP